MDFSTIAELGSTAVIGTLLFLTLRKASLMVDRLLTMIEGCMAMKQELAVVTQLVSNMKATLAEKPDDKRR